MKRPIITFRMSQSNPASATEFRPRGHPMAPPTGTALPSVADFLRDLGRSRAVEPSRVDRLYAESPPDRRRQPDALADHLVELGELTRYQADKLLVGDWQSLVLGPYRLL